MTLLVANKPLSAESVNLTANILDLNLAPHSMTFSDYQQVLTIVNGEAVPITVNLLGDGVTDYKCPAYGDIDVSGGKDFIVAAGDTVTLYTSTFKAFLGANGNSVAITVTSSTATDLASIWLSEY